MLEGGCRHKCGLYLVSWGVHRYMGLGIVCVCVPGTYMCDIEKMNVPGLLLRQMKWPAWGDGRSSEEQKREENTEAMEGCFFFTPQSRCVFVTVRM